MARALSTHRVTIGLLLLVANAIGTAFAREIWRLAVEAWHVHGPAVVSWVWSMLCP